MKTVRRRRSPYSTRPNWTYFRLSAPNLRPKKETISVCYGLLCGTRGRSVLVGDAQDSVGSRHLKLGIRLQNK